MEFPRTYPARWITDQNFDMPPYDFLHPFYDMHLNYYRPWWNNQSISKEFRSTVENEKGKYKITLDVKHFQPHEINIKATVNEIIVEGKHEERADTHGFISRQFKRRYPLPNYCLSENITSTLSSEGILTIIAEKSSSQEKEKIVPIKVDAGWRSFRKTPIDTKIMSEASQTREKESKKDTEYTLLNKKQYEMMTKEDHSRLLKPALYKEPIVGANGTSVEKTEKTDALNISDTTHKIEEKIEKSIMGLTALNEQLGHSVASTSEEKCVKKGESVKADIGITTAGSPATDIKITTDICGIKSTPDTKTTTFMKDRQDGAEIIDMVSKSLTGLSDVKTIVDTSTKQGVVDMKRGSEMCESIITSEKSGVKIGSEMRIMKEISKMTTEESLSSCTTSSSKSSSIMTSGKLGDRVSDISAELRQAAENV